MKVLDLCACLVNLLHPDLWDIRNGMYHLEALEYFRLLEHLSEFAHSDLGRECVLSFRPLLNLREVERAFARVKEAMEFVDVEGDLQLAQLEDLSGIFDAASVEGAVLTPDAVKKVRGLLILAANVKKRLSDERYPNLRAFVSGISELKGLREAIDSVLDQAGRVRDDASKRLSEIRARISAIRGQIAERLRRFLSDPRRAGWFSDRNIHLRGDRYTVAVKSERAGYVKGLVVDTSASGRTVYMEPESVVQLNNRLAMARDEERREEERILRDLTSKIRYHLNSLRENQNLLAQIDALFAKARFAKEYRASVPQVGQQRRIHIIEGRHPILCRVKGVENVVPLDLELGSDFTTLIITGPNTGGKTVALKTVGLLTLMALSGIPVTAHPDSYFGFFRKVLADIGDEQDIESSLSTFSSHIKRIKTIVENADRDTLVLIDELGTGTDPEEGSALAVAIAEHLHKRGSLNVITTHHGDLKLLAYATPGMENASVEFDVESLSPTYRLLVGVPGESNAFVIAERLGLSGEVVERARALKGERLGGKGEVVSWIMRAKSDVEKKLEEAERLKEQAKRQLEEARREAERIKEEAYSEAARLVETAKSSIEEARSKGSGAVVKVAREVARRIAKEKEKEVRERISAGDVVELPAFGLKGRVVEVRGAKVEVDTGRMRMTVPLSSVKPTGERAEECEAEGRRDVSVSIERSRDSFYPELKLLGKRVDEAIPELERFLNDGCLFGIKQLRIVHGKGEGILKRAVHDYLRDHPLVASFRLADEREGGSGVTLVELV